MTRLSDLLDELELMMAPLEIQGALPAGLPFTEVTDLLDPFLAGRSVPHEVVTFYTRFDGLSGRLPSGEEVKTPLGRALAPLHEAVDATTFYRKSWETAVPGIAHSVEELWPATWLALSWEGGTPCTDLAVAEPSSSPSPVFVLDPGSNQRTIPVATSLAEVVSWLVTTLRQREYRRDDASGLVIPTRDAPLTGVPRAASWLVPPP